MSSLSKILVATDLKKETNALLNYAIDMALHFNASLTVLHVIDHRDKVKSEDDPQKRIIENTKLLTEKKEHLESLLKSLKPAQSPVIDVKSRIGYIHRQINLVANEESVDLILLGKKSKGLSFSFESTVDEVIGSAPAPVLVVPHGMKFASFQSKLYATDFLYEDSKSINYFNRLGGNLSCLHVINNDEEPSLSIKKMEVLKDIFDNGRQQFFVEKGKTTSTILDFSKRINADLIGLTHKQRDIWNYFFQASISKYIIKKSDIPTIVFQEL